MPASKICTSEIKYKASFIDLKVITCRICNIIPPIYLYKRLESLERLRFHMQCLQTGICFIQAVTVVSDSRTSHNGPSQERTVSL